MFDTTLAITRLIFDGFLDRYPDLKLIAAHGGGTLPYLVGRMTKGDEVELPQRRRMTAPPREYLRRLLDDSYTYDLGALQYLISVVGAEQVLFGTDWPHGSSTWAHSRVPPRSHLRSVTRSAAITRRGCSGSVADVGLTEHAND